MALDQIANPSRRAVKMYTQSHAPTPELSTEPPPLPTQDEQERDEALRQAERLDRQNERCRMEVDGLLREFCRGGGTA